MTYILPNILPAILHTLGCFGVVLLYVSISIILLTLIDVLIDRWKRVWRKRK